MNTKKKSAIPAIPWMVRQGDVLVERALKSAKTKAHAEVSREEGRVILAHGEVTGHAHAFRDPGVCLLRAEGISDRVLTVSDEFASLVHEEHGTIEIPTGTFIVRRQLEWSDEEQWQVQD